MELRQTPRASMLTLLWMKLNRLHSKAAGEGAVIRRFSPDLDVPMATAFDDRDGKRSKVTALEGGWRYVTNHARTFQLFDVLDSDLGGHKLTYRAELCCRDLRGRAYLELWCRIPGVGEYTSKGVHTAIQGTKTWQPCETSIHIKPGHRPDRIRLCVAIEGDGIVEARGVEVVGISTVPIPLWQRAFLVPAWLIWSLLRFTTLVVVNAMLIGFSIWAQGRDMVTWGPRARGPKLGKRRTGPWWRVWAGSASKR